MMNVDTISLSDFSVWDRMLLGITLKFFVRVLRGLPIKFRILTEGHKGGRAKHERNRNDHLVHLLKYSNLQTLT